jgi:hypothetical protein
MDDLISRQALCEYALNQKDKSVTPNDIMRFPSAMPKRPKGEWIPEFNGNFTSGAYWFSCSKCNRIVPEVRNGGWDYCPSCGAYMKDD